MAIEAGDGADLAPHPSTFPQWAKACRIDLLADPERFREVKLATILKPE
jgi:hypothetical protein